MEYLYISGEEYLKGLNESEDVAEELLRIENEFIQDVTLEELIDEVKTYHVGTEIAYAGREGLDLKYLHKLLADNGIHSNFKDE